MDLTPGPGSSTAGSTDYSITSTVTEIGLITPSITWRAPGDMVISTDTDFTVGAVTGYGPTYSSVLLFHSLKTSQAGEYTCTAEVNSVTVMSSTVISVTSMSIHDSVLSYHRSRSLHVDCTEMSNSFISTSSFTRFSYCGVGSARFAHFTLHSNPVFVINKWFIA